MQARSRGNLGEELARQYLEKHGFKILEKQYFARVGEIDIIAERDSRLHFVEVKTRSSREFGYPEDAMTPAKIRRVRKATKIYLLNRRISHENYQIDVITVELNWDIREARVRHLENVIGD